MKCDKATTYRTAVGKAIKRLGNHAVRIRIVLVVNVHVAKRAMQNGESRYSETQSVWAVMSHRLKMEAGKG